MDAAGVVAVRADDGLVCDAFPFHEPPVLPVMERAAVHEYVLSLVIGSDVSEPTIGVKPQDGSGA
jgi:hypothetical protein